jgi:dUTP pyrophosphatase
VPGPVDAPRHEPLVPPSVPAVGRARVAPVEVLLDRLDPDLPVPAHAHPGDAGVDLCCTADVRLDPGERAVVGTGVAVALPEGYAGFVHPRSGLAARSGLSIVNAPGTVDAGYRGEIRVCLINHDPREPVLLRRGDRIAQLVVQRVERVRFVEVTELPPSVRGTGGYGSTGGHAGLVAELDLPPGDPATDLGDPLPEPVTADPVRSDLGGVDSVAGSSWTRPVGPR